MPRHLRPGRYAQRLAAPNENKDLAERCPKCEAAPGWRCVRYVGAQRMVLKNAHKERTGRNR